MCRSIKTLRTTSPELVSADEVRAAALQYVRKVAGMRHPSQVNEAAFSAAVDRVTQVTDQLLHDLTPRRTAPVHARAGGLTSPAAIPTSGRPAGTRGRH